MEITWIQIAAMLWAGTKSILTGGSPFAARTVLFPPNTEGKYVIAAEGIRLAFTTHGGALTNLWINDTNAIERDIVLGFDQADDAFQYKANPYLNGVIGRYAGMISGAGFAVDGIRYQTSPNHNGGSATFNGGDKGWGRQELSIASHSKNSITFVIFDHEWNGFPGSYGACITHTATPYEWHIAIGLTPVQKASPVSLSQQVFWNLNGFALDANRSVTSHDLHLPFSGMRFAVDENKIPTGDITGNLLSSSLDYWSEPRKVMEPFDETFMITRRQRHQRGPAPVAHLYSPLSGIKVELYTDQDALRVHTWTSQQDPVRLKPAQGGTAAVEMAALSMEMYNWPDALNHPEWQRQEETIWGPEGLYTTFSSFKFDVDNGQSGAT